MTRVLGIDPGSSRTGWALYDTDDRCVIESGESEAAEPIDFTDSQPDLVVIERPRAYGPARPDVVECAWVAGRLFQWAFEWSATGAVFNLLRREICDELGAAVHQKALRDDKAVRAVLIELHGEGSHKKGGPLAGVKGHAWAALAAAYAWVLRNKEVKA